MESSLNLNLQILQLIIKLYNKIKMNKIVIIIIKKNDNHQYNMNI